jgi:uncharacterized protein (UPF0332 family)
MKKNELTFMDWRECERDFIARAEKDQEKISSILHMTKKRHIFITSVEVNDNNISFIVENYYEIIKELLVALLLEHGLKSKNHQCLITYFHNNYPQYEGESYTILQMNYVRNRLNYYGEEISRDFYDHDKNNFEQIIKLLANLVEIKRIEKKT